MFTCDVEYAKADLLFGQRVLFDPHACDYHHHDYDMLGVYAQLKRRPPTLKTLDVFWTLHYDDHDSTAGESGTHDRKTHTIGTHFAGALGEHWDYGGTLAVQRGKWGRDDIDACGLNARAGQCEAGEEPGICPRLSLFQTGIGQRHVVLWQWSAPAA